MNEAISKGHYDVSSYEDIIDDSNQDEDKYEIYQRIITQEFVYWLIMTEWNYFSVIGFSENEEWNITNPKDLITKLSLSHELYVVYIQKIISPPDPDLMSDLYN